MFPSQILELLSCTISRLQKCHPPYFSDLCSYTRHNVQFVVVQSVTIYRFWLFSLSQFTVCVRSFCHNLKFLVVPSVTNYRSWYYHLYHSIHFVGYVLPSLIIHSNSQLFGSSPLGYSSSLHNIQEYTVQLDS